MDFEQKTRPKGSKTRLNYREKGREFLAFVIYENLGIFTSFELIFL